MTEQSYLIFKAIPYPTKVGWTGEPVPTMLPGNVAIVERLPDGVYRIARLKKSWYAQDVDFASSLPEAVKKIQALIRAFVTPTAAPSLLPTQKDVSDAIVKLERDIEVVVEKLNRSRTAESYSVDKTLELEHKLSYEAKTRTELRKYIAEYEQQLNDLKTDLAKLQTQLKAGNELPASEESPKG
jgi:hypothetical protein